MAKLWPNEKPLQPLWLYHLLVVEPGSFFARVVHLENSHSVGMMRGEEQDFEISIF